MTPENYIQLLQQPELLDDSHMMQLEEWIKKYPYFQSARALHLKGLHRQNSFRYNTALKETASHTVDRSVLFDFITSDRFKAYKPVEIDLGSLGFENDSEQADYIKTSKSVLDSYEDPFVRKEDTEVTDRSPISVEENIPYGNETPSQTTEKEGDTNEIARIEARLDIGKPLAFEKNEIHSFEEWLQLTRLKPIDREAKDNKIDDTSVSAAKPHEETLPIAEKVPSEKRKKLDIIDKFIASNPKIVPKKDFVADIQIQSQPSDPSQLMTETLAKIYLEQKKYQKAIKAYEILILKYPEKSYLFADRIADIKKLQQ